MPPERARRKHKPADSGRNTDKKAAPEPSGHAELRSTKGGGKSGRGEAAAGRRAGEESYWLRLSIFGSLAVCIATIGVWFSADAIRRNEADKNVPLTATQPAEVYTVKLVEFPSSERSRAQELSETPVVQSLAGECELFFPQVGEQRLALCVGKFSSPDGGRIKEVLKDFRDFTREGKRMFASAAIHRCP